MKIFWKNKDYQDELDLVRTQERVAAATLRCVESIYKIQLFDKNNEEIFDTLRQHDDTIFWDAWDKGMQAGLCSAFHGLAHAGIISDEVAETFIMRSKEFNHATLAEAMEKENDTATEE